MVSHEKLNGDVEKCGSTLCEEDLNYKNAFSFLSMENYQNFLNSYSQNHFLNDGTTILQDEIVQDVLQSQVLDPKQSTQNIVPRKLNVPCSEDQNLSNFYHSLTCEFRQQQAKEVGPNDPYFDFPMDLSNMFLQNSGPSEPQDAFINMSSACSSGVFADPIPTSSHFLTTYDEPKTFQSNPCYHFPKGNFSDSVGIFSDGTYTRGFEVLKENSEKFQSLPHLEPNIEFLDSLNDVKDFTISSYNDDNNNNNTKLNLTNSKSLPTDAEKNCNIELKNQRNSQIFSPVEFTSLNLNQSLNYQGIKNFDHVLPSSKTLAVPDFPICNIPVLDLPPDFKFSDFPSNMKPNQVAEISAGSKNGNWNSEYWQKNVHLTNKENYMFLNSPKNSAKEFKSFQYGIKHKSLCKSDNKLTPNKRLKPDYVKILPAIAPAKQIPMVNITMHQIPNSCKMPISNNMDTAIPNIENNHSLNLSNRNLTRPLASKKVLKKIPVSIKARNAKFLCAEKDLRCRTVRELLETCETIQGKKGVRAKVDPYLSSIPAENFYRLAPQTFPSQTVCLSNLTDNSGGVEKNDREKLHLQPPPESHVPVQRIYDLKSNPQSTISPDHSLRVYQPVVDTWKMSKFASYKKNAFKPKHFDFSFLQIRNFKYFCSDSEEKRTSKLKLIFSKKKLAYEFQLKETFDSSGGCIKHLAMIEIKFSSIVAMWGHNQEFRLEINEAPHMYVGTRFCNKGQQFGPHQNAQYDRSRTADLTSGELYQVPFHYIQLRCVSVSKVLSCLSEFSPHFERMLRCPLIEDMHKVLPQMQLTLPELVPIRINKIYLPNNGLEVNKQEVLS